jgi:hypothetical protein
VGVERAERVEELGLFHGAPQRSIVGAIPRSSSFFFFFLKHNKDKKTQSKGKKKPPEEKRKKIRRERERVCLINKKSKIQKVK